MGMLKKEDLDVWKSYIDKLYKSPEEKFIPSKAKLDLPKILDLHGMTIQRAFNETNMFLDRHYSIGSKLVTIITGKDGKINDEFPHWCDNFSFVKECEPLTDTRGQHGAYLIYFKSRR